MSDEESIQAIQQRMHQVRREIGTEMVELVAHARDMTDWRNYVRAYPWVSIAAAAAVGYLIVPKGSPRMRLDDATLESISQLTRVAPVDGESIPVVRRLGRTAAKMAVAAVWRGLLGYVGNRLAKSAVTATGPEHNEF